MQKNNSRLFLVLILFLLCCTGCSKVSLGYNNADWLLRYWISDYTTFSPTQSEQIHVEVDDYLRWHRREALPGYITFLRHVNTAINQDGGPAVADVVRLRSESTELYQMTMTPMIQPAAQQLGSLDSAQITELADTFAERSNKQRRKILHDTELKTLEKRAQRHVEFVESLVGNLNDEQVRKITEMSLRIPLASRHYIEQREAKHATLIAMLRDKAGEERIATLFRQWLTAPAIFRTPQQQQSIVAYESAMNEMTVRIFEMLTAPQRQHLRETLRTWIGELDSLQAKAGPGTGVKPL